MKFSELKNKSAAELKKELQAAQEQLIELRFKASTRELKNVREIRRVRKMIARLETALRDVHS